LPSTAVKRGRPIIDLRDQRFGRLLVIESAGFAKDHNVLWKCKCDCGNETVVRGVNLRKGHTTSCGCALADHYKKITLPVREAVIRRSWQQYQQNAEFRKLEWSLDEATFRSLVESPCFYCNADPLNGVDRLDSKQGYSLVNVVSCCRVCNFMKASMSLDDFLAQIDRVYNHLVRR
jgi:hypothetical protein